jgi:hypothetical protein
VRRLILVVALVAAAVGATVALAGVPSPDNPAGRSGDILGIVPAFGASHNAGHSGSGGNLSYHNGPVMHTNNVYAIYWTPSATYPISSSYQSLINQFFTDVTADHSVNNVYYSDTQYYDGGGAIQDASAFTGSTVDTNALPSSGCTDSYTSVCLSDTQIQVEIDSVAKAHGWSRTNSIFFMFTGKGVGSCYASSSCSFSQYCAYHSNFNSTSGNTLYANMPYADTVPAACDSNNSPNANEADATINVTSHEHNETITDALGSAWYDRRGYENGDKCAWNFGTQLGGSTGSYYNQVINSHHYELQQEWSNASSGCVLTNK